MSSHTCNHAAQRACECGPSTRCCSFLSAPLLHHRLAGPLALGGAGARPLPCKLRVAEHHLGPKTGSYSYFVGSWPVHFIACVIPQGASPPYFDRQFCRRFVLSWIYICCWKSELNNESLRALKGVLVAHSKMRKLGKASLIGIPCKKNSILTSSVLNRLGEWVGATV